MARPLNNELRDDLAVQLAVQAVKRHGPALGRLAKHLTKDHRKIFEDKLRDYEPSIPLKQWAELIQKKLVNGKSQSDSQHYHFLKPAAVEGGDPKRDVTTIYSGKITQFGTNKKLEDQRYARYERFIRLLKQQTGFGTVMDLYCSTDMCRRTAYLDLKAPAQPDLPGFPGGYYLDDTIPVESKLIADYKATTARLFRILVEGWAYLEQCHELLEACKNEKQLEDLFPEAAKLMPPPVANSRGTMVPTELAAKVRKMLETGVPAE